MVKLLAFEAPEWVWYVSIHLNAIQNHALRLCLGAYRTSPASSLCVEANDPPLYFRKKNFHSSIAEN